MRDHVIAFLEGEGRGVVTSGELRAIGVEPAALRTLLREKVVVRIARGVYALASAYDPPAGTVARHELSERRHLLLLDGLLRSCRSPMAASHQSAALAWGLPMLTGHLDLVRISHTRKGATGRRFATHITYRCDHTDAFTKHDGRCLVVPGLAVVGTALRCGIQPGLVAVDAALRRKLVTVEVLEEWLARMRRHPGISLAKTMVKLADGSSESPGETLLRLILVQLGIRFETQFWVRAADGRFFRADFYLPDHGVILEFDGHSKYSDQGRGHDERWAAGGNALSQEKSREDAIRAEGFGVGRVVWSGLSVSAVSSVIERAKGQALPGAFRRASAPPPWEF